MENQLFWRGSERANAPLSLRRQHSTAARERGRGCPRKTDASLQAPSTADLGLPCTFALSPCNARTIHRIIPWDKGHEAPARDWGTAMRKATRTEELWLLPRWRGTPSLTGITRGGRGVSNHEPSSTSFLFLRVFHPEEGNPSLLLLSRPRPGAGSPCAEHQAPQHQQQQQRGQLPPEALPPGCKVKAATACLQWEGAN